MTLDNKIYYELRLKEPKGMNSRKRMGLHKRMRLYAKGSGYKYFLSPKAAMRWLDSLPTGDTFKKYWYVGEWSYLNFDLANGTIK